MTAVKRQLQSSSFILMKAQTIFAQLRHPRLNDNGLRRWSVASSIRFLKYYPHGSIVTSHLFADGDTGTAKRH